MGFQDLLAKNGGFGGQNRGRDGAILTTNELVLTFRGFYVCANFGENRSRNATVRVLADGQTHTHTQTQTDFIICPMLYAIAMGQIMTNKHDRNHTLNNTVYINYLQELLQFATEMFDR